MAGLNIEDTLSHLKSCKKKLHCIHSLEELDRNEINNVNIHDYKIFIIDGRNIDNKERLLKAISSEMKFPDYFGMNWDALDECLLDLDSWIPANGYVIILDNFINEAAIPLPFDMLNTFFKILIDATERWKSKNKSFHVIIVGNCDHLSNIAGIFDSQLCIV